ncbi:ABC-type transport auxiliary lipoprotein family protein [Sphingomonas sp. MMS24-J13]|uniref:ABC-type transport auxiliary lipoprotein family protein n=1 Tax=Sphingomonas sp. MMS24-J13 TaxID=3238686 RepID=UPI00384DC251
MIMFRACAWLAPLSLCGCAASLLAPQPATTLYRLEGAAPLPVATDGAVVVRQTVRLTVNFATGIDGDRLLTVRGRQAMYLKGARWIAPAPDLFSKAVEYGFARHAPEIMIVTATDRARNASRILDVRIDHFEAAYSASANADAPPTVTLNGEARLLRANGTLVASWRVASEAHAGRNNVGAIVDAFGLATDACIDQLANEAASRIMAAPS